MNLLKIILGILIILIIIGAFFIWQGIYLPKDRLSEIEKTFLIEKGQGAREIAANLEDQGLIKCKFFFLTYVLVKGVIDKLQAGEYLLSPAMTIPEITEKFVTGEIITIEVTIPEGFTINQIEERINEKLKMKNEKRQLKIKNLLIAGFEKEFEFLADTPPTLSLQGYLFPDTYQFSYGATADEIVRKILDNFDRKLTPDLRKEISQQGKTIFEIVTMASLLEKEVTSFEDRQLVSGILWKRLENNVPLQVDATITYITGKKTTRISKEETKIDSPYNTYKYKGLPLGPICNPGLESIKAALYPKDSQYLYYLSTPAAEGEPRPNGREGKTIFSKTLEEHNLAKAKYLR